MTWVDLSSAFGYGTKLTSTQMQNLRDNITALANGDSGAPAIKEAAVDTGAITEGKIGASAVSQAKLKTSTHEQSTTESVWTEKILTYAEYGFACRIKYVGGSGTADFKRSDDTDSTSAGTSYTGESVHIKAAGGATTAYVIYRYISSSGEVFWIWILRNKVTKKIISADIASDHCSFGLPDPSLRPHPFGNSYDSDKHEIILVNPDQEELETMYARKGERDLLETILSDYEIDESIEKEWPKIPVTLRIKNDDWFERYITKTPVDIEKDIIPKLDYVLCKSLKLKNG